MDENEAIECDRYYRMMTPSPLFKIQAVGFLIVTIHVRYIALLWLAQPYPVIRVSSSAACQPQ